MYNVAFVEDDKCVAQKGCRLCIMYCPEADCIKLDSQKMKAYVQSSKDLKLISNEYSNSLNPRLNPLRTKNLWILFPKFGNFSLC